MNSVSAVSSHDHVQGLATAKATLLEYGDYQCSYCGEAKEVVQAVQRRMGAAMRFVFRNFPLPDLHPNALGAACAAEAAGLQGKFWQMHEALYGHQSALGSAARLGYAEALGLDIKQFQRDAGSDAVREHVAADLDSGKRAGVRGTPTFYVNGVLLGSDWRGEGLTVALRAAAVFAGRSTP